MLQHPLIGSTKQTTKIVELYIVPNAREVLIGLYCKILQEIQKVPKEYQFRKAVERITNQKLMVCQEEEDLKKIENRLGCGQVEELIINAKDQLKLIGDMII